MHVRQCTYGQAVAWLKQIFGADQTVAAIVVDAQFKAQVIVAEAKPPTPFSPPVRVEKNWSLVRQWLTTERSLAEDLVDWLHDCGRVYSNEQADAVFLMVDARGQPVGAEIESMAPTPFAGVAAGTSRNAGAFTIPPRHDERGPLVLVESAIDAISYAQLHQGQDVEVRSTVRARSQIPWVDPKRYIVVAFGADSAGDRAAAKLLVGLPSIHGRRERPTAKNWNEMAEGKSRLEIERLLDQAPLTRKPAPKPGPVSDDPDVTPF